MAKPEEQPLSEWEVSDLLGTVTAVNWSAARAQVYRRDRWLDVEADGVLVGYIVLHRDGRPCDHYTAIVRRPGQEPSSERIPGGHLPKDPVRYAAWAASHGGSPGQPPAG